MAATRQLSFDTPLLATLARAIDPADPVPIYHQIAAVIRREIASGRLPIGAVLPSLRAVELALDVNYHTIRHAWDELNADGVLAVRRGRGAVVVRAPRGDDGWRVAPAAPNRDQTADTAPIPVVWVAVAGTMLAAELAGRLMMAWRVIAAPWPLDAAPPPPPGTIFRTLSGEPSAWPARADETVTLPLTLERDAITRITDHARALRVSQIVLLAAPGDGDQQDLLRQLPRIGLQTTCSSVLADIERRDQLTVVLPSGRLLAQGHTAGNPFRLDLPAVWSPGPLAGTAHQLGWQRATPRPTN